MKIRQFYHEHHKIFRYYFIIMEDNSSRYKDGADLFGGDDKDYTSNFKLELTYG